MSEIVGSRTVDLNVDIGEGFPYDTELLQFASSANVCCGVHAGSPELTEETIALCRKHRVRIGAHPGYPDRSTMGRALMAVGQEREFLGSVFEQVRWMIGLTDLGYIKPHGGFYNDTAITLPDNWQVLKISRDTPSRYDAGGLFLAQYPGIQSLQMMLRIYKLPLMGLAPTAHSPIAERAHQILIREGFADRRYLPDGTLTPRREADSVLTNPAEIEAQVVRLLPEVDSICLHGDTPGCVAIAERIYRLLVDRGIGVGA